MYQECVSNSSTLTTPEDCQGRHARLWKEILNLLPDAWRTNPNVQFINPALSYALHDFLTGIVSEKQDNEKRLTNADMSHYLNQPLKQSVDDFRSSVARMLERTDNPYHNACHQDRDVIERFRETSSRIIPSARPVQVELGLCASLIHDVDHCGATLRQKVFPGEELSNEEFSVLRATTPLLETMNPLQVLEVQCEVLATSFGQSVKALAQSPDTIPYAPGAVLADGLKGGGWKADGFEKSLAYRDYIPVTERDKILVWADVAVTFGSFEEWISDLSVRLFREAKDSGGSFPKDALALAEAQAGFAEGYLPQCLENIRPYVGKLFYNCHQRKASDFAARLRAAAAVLKGEREGNELEQSDAMLCQEAAARIRADV